MHAFVVSWLMPCILFHRQSQRSMKVCIAFLVACIGYHDNNCKQTMMPIALWIRKNGLSSVKMFVMHSITMPWCIHHISSMIGCGSIGHQNFHSHKHGVRPSAIFKKKRFYHVKVKNLELASLRKLRQQMNQVQCQPFSKVYKKIWDLATIEVSVVDIAFLT